VPRCDECGNRKLADQPGLEDGSSLAAEQQDVCALHHDEEYLEVVRVETEHCCDHVTSPALPACGPSRCEYQRPRGYSAGGYPQGVSTAILRIPYLERVDSCQCQSCERSTAVAQRSAQCVDASQGNGAGKRREEAQRKH